jgi:hypothetical protein
MGKVVKKKKAATEAGEPSGVKQKKIEGHGAKAVPERKPFTRRELFSKPKELQNLFSPIREAEVNAEIVRPRMQTESVEHGRGQGLLRHYTFRKFKEVPKAVLFMNQPRSQRGAFEPTDRLLTPGEQMRLTYTTTVEGADRRAETLRRASSPCWTKRRARLS